MSRRSKSPYPSVSKQTASRSRLSRSRTRCLTIPGLATALACFLSPFTAHAGLKPANFTGTLRLSVSTFPAATFQAAGTVALTDDGFAHLLSLGIAAGGFGPSTTSLVVTASPTVNSVRFTGIHNLTGSFGPNLSGGPPGGGTMGLQGTAKICLAFDATCNFVRASFRFTPTGALASVLAEPRL